MYNFFKKYFTIVGTASKTRNIISVCFGFNNYYGICLRLVFRFFYVNRIQLIFVIYFCILVLFLLILFYHIRCKASSARPNFDLVSLWKFCQVVLVRQLNVLSETRESPQIPTSKNTHNYSSLRTLTV